MSKKEFYGSVAEVLHQEDQGPKTPRAAISEGSSCLPAPFRRWALLFLSSPQLFYNRHQNPRYSTFCPWQAATSLKISYLLKINLQHHGSMLRSPRLLNLSTVKHLMVPFLFYLLQMNSRVSLIALATPYRYILTHTYSRIWIVWVGLQLGNQSSSTRSAKRRRVSKGFAHHATSPIEWDHCTYSAYEGPSWHQKQR